MIRTIQGLSILERPLEFIVVGEHRQDAGRLLLRGDDGGYYELCIRTHEVIPATPDDEWNIESTLHSDLDLYVA